MGKAGVRPIFMILRKSEFKSCDQFGRSSNLFDVEFCKELIMQKYKITNHQKLHFCCSCTNNVQLLFIG
jgi:hypothetical protein